MKCEDKDSPVVLVGLNQSTDHGSYRHDMQRWFVQVDKDVKTKHFEHEFVHGKSSELAFVQTWSGQKKARVTVSISFVQVHFSQKKLVFLPSENYTTCFTITNFSKTKALHGYKSVTLRHLRRTLLPVSSSIEQKTHPAFHSLAQSKEVSVNRNKSHYEVFSSILKNDKRKDSKESLDLDGKRFLLTLKYVLEVKNKNSQFFFHVPFLHDLLYDSPFFSHLVVVHSSKTKRMFSDSFPFRNPALTLDKGTYTIELLLSSDDREVLEGRKLSKLSVEMKKLQAVFTDSCVGGRR